jgi:hypothetical protein
MTHAKLESIASMLGALTLGVLTLSSCTEDPPGEDPTAGDDTSSASASSGGSSGMTAADDDDDADEETGMKLDSLMDTEGPSGCSTDSSECTMIDLLFVVDNSGTMGEEQLNLATNFPLLIQQLQGLEDANMNMLNPSVNIMVTTTDFGHPLCTPFNKPDYSPRQGAPVYEGCNARINRFTGLGNDPLVITEACTQNCPADVAPADQFIHFDINGSNVPGDNVSLALSCIGPQGIDGCGYEAQLESMLQAINPEACWNDPDHEGCADHPEWGAFNKPFLRDGAILAIALITDEVECSVQAPGGFSYFTDEMNTMYWEMHPGSESPQPSSAICWNAGVTCSGPDANGIYTDCTSATNDVLHPIDRYISYLKFLTEEREKDVVMLGILGVPPVTAHSPTPPFQPTAGGVDSLVYRAWQESDLLPQEVKDGVEVEDKIFEFGDIAPGCVGMNVSGQYTGVAIPPTRILEVCESLNVDDNPETVENEAAIRCCVESICDENFSAAIQCLTGAIADTVMPAG